MTETTALPYRFNAGIALFNTDGLVFAGRSHGDGPETVRDGLEWQMPQGGIDPGEDLVDAARRELWEETNIRDAAFLAVTETWWPYEFPPYDGPWHHLCDFRGQTQRWVAFRYTGDGHDINVTEPESGVRAEFFAWAWKPLASLPALVMPHKRATYEKVAEAFAAFAKAA